MRTFLQKARRFSTCMKKNESSLLRTINNHKPQFWKDKPKKTIKQWSKAKIKDLITNVNKTETNLKKNSSLGLMLVFDFIYETLERN